MIVHCQISIIHNEFVSYNEKRSLQCLYLLVLLAPQQNPLPSFAAVPNLGTDGITQVPSCRSPWPSVFFFSGTASYLSLILIINIWLEMNSKHFVTGVTRRVLMTDSKSVAAITDQYDQFGLSLPATLVTTDMSIHRHQKNLTGNVTFPIGNLTFPVKYPSCLLNLPYIAIQTLPFWNPNASQVT